MFEQQEKKELTGHLEGQINDIDQLIGETEVQIRQMKEQINKITTALDERQNIINEQIGQLNVIRQ